MLSKIKPTITLIIIALMFPLSLGFISIIRVIRYISKTKSERISMIKLIYERKINLINLN